jgi:hypothetical protein
MTDSDNKLVRVPTHLQGYAAVALFVYAEEADKLVIRLDCASSPVSVNGQQMYPTKTLGEQPE